VYKLVQVLADACRHLELATTKFHEIGYEDVAKELEIIQTKVYERLGLIKEREVKEEELKDDGLIKEDEINDELKDIKTQEEPGEAKQPPTEAGDGKEPIIWITEVVGYRYNKESDEFVLVYKKPYGIFTLKKFKRIDLLKIWNDLPKKATKTDVEQIARKHGLKIGSVAQYVMRIFTHVFFDGEIKIQGKQLFLVKPDNYNFHEEIRRQLQLEKELIDSKGWGK
jgi:hypothetical protein